MKADKTYVFGGAIYLPGAEMPEGWEPPKQPKQSAGVTMFGPGGLVTELPGLPLPPGVSGPAKSPEEQEAAMAPQIGNPNIPGVPQVHLPVAGGPSVIKTPEATARSEKAAAEAAEGDKNKKSK